MNSRPDTSQPEILTPLSRDEQLRLWPLAAHAAYIQRQTRYVSYEQAAEDAAQLAQALSDCLSARELRQAHFQALPRGGLIVLGLLAYQLDLRHEQLLPVVPAPGQTLVLVDDCALSGAMLQKALAAAPAPRIVAAHLYSAPALREAVRAADQRVICCVAAQDLQELESSNPDAAQEKQMQAYLSERLLTKAVQPVAFAWSEPDSLVLDPFQEQPDTFWRFVPPHRSLANREALGLPPRPPASRRWLVPSEVVYGRFGTTLYLLQTAQPEAYKLQGLPADIWRALAGYGSEEAALELLRETYPDLSPDVLGKAIDNAVTHFTSLDLLQAS